MAYDKKSDVDSRPASDHTPNLSITLDLEQAAKFLHMSCSALRAKAKSGVVRGAKPARRWVFLVAELEAYLCSLYPETVEKRSSDITHREVKKCHSINVEQHGGYVLQPQMVSEYANRLGLITKPKRRSITTSSKHTIGKSRS